VAQPRLPAGTTTAGNTYVVVVKGIGETLPSVLQTAAPGSGLQPRGQTIADYPEATLYQLTPSRATASSHPAG
jgi:hypothetical protein